MAASTRTIAIILCCAAVTLSCAHTKEVQPWHEVTDGAVVLRSCGNDADTLELARDFREVRATLAQFIPTISANDTSSPGTSPADASPQDTNSDSVPVPFNVHVFCRDSGIVETAPKPAQANHYVRPVRDIRFNSSYEAERVAVAVRASGTHVAARGGELPLSGDLLRHHYAHHLIRAHADVPIWIEEGLAAFVTTLKSGQRSDVVRGRPTPGVVSLGGAGITVPLGRVFRATDLSTWPYLERMTFYQTSWTFIHYLYFDRWVNETPPGPKLLRFAELRAMGVDEGEAAQDAFGRNLVGLRNGAERYVRTHSVLVSRGRPEAAIDTTAGAGLEARALSAHDVAFGLGVLGVEGGRPDAALIQFDRAIATDSESGPAHAGRALALAAVGSWSAAGAALARADELEPDSQTVLLYGARALLAKADSRRAEDGEWSRAESRAVKVLELEPELAEANFLFAQSLSGQREIRATLEALERAHLAWPAAFEIDLPLAESLANAGRVDEARTLAERIGGWVLGEERGKSVRRFLDQLPPDETLAAQSN